MPGELGRHPDRGRPWNLNHGFSPGQTIVVKVPGIDTPEALARPIRSRSSAL